MSHTKGPWKVFVVYAHPEIRDENDAFVASLGAGDVTTARRIVACVNACAGMKTEELENYKREYVLGMHVFDLVKQRDDLSLRESREAIASVKGGAA